MGGLLRRYSLSLHHRGTRFQRYFRDPPKLATTLHLVNVQERKNTSGWLYTRTYFILFYGQQVMESMIANLSYMPPAISSPIERSAWDKKLKAQKVVSLAVRVQLANLRVCHECDVKLFRGKRFLYPIRGCVFFGGRGDFLHHF